MVLEMDFDEYDYLEKTVENPDTCLGNGINDMIKDGEAHSLKHKINETEGKNVQSHSKRLKHDGVCRDGERHRERISSCHHRSQSRDIEKDPHRSGREHRDHDMGSDREERNGRERYKNRDRQSDRIRDYEWGWREGDRETERDRNRDRERERSRSHRSGSQLERHRYETDKREKERSRERDHKERDKERERERESVKEKEREKEARERDRDLRKPKEKKEELEPEADPERDQRTVFAYQISLKADERNVYEFFSRAGKVRDVRLIMDRNSRRSKGVGYIEFYDAMSVPMAIALTGQPLLGQPVMVKPSEAEKNLVQSTTAGSGGLIGPYSGGARRLYIGNLHFNFTEDQLRQVFEPFGTVELVQLPLDEAGHCKGFGFVQFVRLEDARNALNLNGQVEIAGRPIKVSAVTDQTGLQDGVSSTTTGADFDDEEGGGLSLNACSRALLMQKLDRSGTDATSSLPGSLVAAQVSSAAAAPISVAEPAASSVAAPPLLEPAPLPPVLAAVNAVPASDSASIPSECLLLNNMFDPKTETMQDFELDIKEDVQEECSKFGNLRHIFVDKDSAGLVYLRFGSAHSAVAAQTALHGRWFAGKMISATFIATQNYEEKFPESR